MITDHLLHYFLPFNLNSSTPPLSPFPHFSPLTFPPSYTLPPPLTLLILILIFILVSSSQDIDHPMVYAALIPIIGGVGLASLKELSFTWTALIAASLANQAAAFKNVVSKVFTLQPN